MAEIAKAVMLVLLAAAFALCGYAARGWQDGTLITKNEADIVAQARVDEAVVWAVKIKDAQNEKNAALRRITSPPRIISTACPPGTGAVSSDALDRMRRAVNAKE